MVIKSSSTSVQELGTAGQGGGGGAGKHCLTGKLGSQSGGIAHRDGHTTVGSQGVSWISTANLVVPEEGAPYSQMTNPLHIFHQKATKRKGRADAQADLFRILIELYTGGQACVHGRCGNLP